jgi:Tol biopolymer transport system component/tRNA A-37 threonylcarbamoyl transferase component Bud32
VHLGPYRIEDRLGAGGMGEVFRARDTRLNRHVAIKVAHERFSERFAREAQVIARLNHPHVCTLYDVGPNYLVMELVEGDTLAGLLRKGPLPMDTVRRYGAQIADALSAAHAKSIVHRDLKPGNVMIARSGVKVLDFGLAKIAEDSAEPLTVTNVVMGTPAYMAPEQKEGKPADARTDIYALGLVLYEMAAGKLPPVGPDTTIEYFPPHLAHVIQGCLAGDPADRWQSAADIKRELSWSYTPPLPPARTRERLAWILAAALASAVLLLALLRPWRPVATLQPIAFQIAPPEGGVLGVAQPQSEVMSMSPSGRYVTFTATLSGQTLLCVRDLSRSSVRTIAGTEGAYSPFWSPDSRWVAFFAAGKLKKVNPDGGSLQSLADVSNTASTGSWGRRGDILFSDLHGKGGIYRLPAEGGQVHPISQLGPSESWQFWPHFLPDGKHFLYLAGDTRGRQVMVASLDGGAPRFLMRESSRAIYTAAGYLFFVREGNLLAQRFDPAGLRLDGQPFPTGVRLDYFEPTGLAPFSVSDRGDLAYQAWSRTSRLAWVDRTGRQTGTVSQPRSYWSVRLSPDGRRLATAVAEQQRGGTEDIYIIELSREAEIRMTFEPGAEFNPIWSADGSQVLFTADMGGVPHLHVKTLDSSVPARSVLPPSGGIQTPLEWLRDGSILYQDHATETNLDLWLLPSEGKPRRILATPFNEMQAAISPDAKWMAYVSDETGKPEVYVRSFPQLGGARPVSNRGGSHPRWSADGRELYYVEDDRLVAVPVKLHPDFAASTPTTLFQQRPGIIDFDVSAEGRFIVNIGRAGFLSAPVEVIVNWLPSLGAGF